MRGSIQDITAYTRGKLLDHSGWGYILPRRITPSDIDIVLSNVTAIDNNGRILLVEFNSKVSCWADIAVGQRRLYENLVRAGSGKIMAALCRHSIPEPGQHLDTVKDVVSFQLLFWGERKGLDVSKVMDGEKWPAVAKNILGFREA